MLNRILLLIPTTSYRTQAFMEAAEKEKLEVVVGTNKRQSLDSLTPGSTLTLDFQNLEQAVSQIVKASVDPPFKAIIGVDDDTVILASMASKALNLVHNPVESVQVTRNKYLTRKILQDAEMSGHAQAKSQILSPNINLCETNQSPALLAKSALYPCVLKPVFLSGSRGVIRANTPEEFVDAFQQITRLLQDKEVVKKGGELAKKILVEEYIPGVEVSLEGILAKGKLKLLALFDKPDPLEGPYFAETIYVTPSRLSAERQQEIMEVVQTSCQIIGLRDGPIHAELRCNEQGTWPIEIAARSIGGLCSRVLEFGGKFSLEELIIKHSLGGSIDSYQRSERAAGVMMIPILKKGVLQKIEGQEQAKQILGIKDVVISLSTGQEVEPLPNNSHYLGFIFAESESPDKVEQQLREAYRCLNIIIE